MRQSIRVKISGDFACFTRPDFKAERESYPVITPSAARGIIDAICWRPAVFWVVRSISILNPIKYFGYKRNEVTELANIQMEYLLADEKRAQRYTLALRDVAYILEVEPFLTSKATNEDSKEKFLCMLERRIKKGQCFTQPSLGLKEFNASFESDTHEIPLSLTQDLGLMLHDIEFGPKNTSHFFRACIENGIINVPYPTWIKNI